MNIIVLNVLIVEFITTFILNSNTVGRSVIVFTSPEAASPRKEPYSIHVNLSENII